MTSLDELKQEIQEEASDNPEKFFATKVLKQNDFHRGQCTNCGMYFWSYNEKREVCGEPECSGGYTFINNSPTSETFSYIDAWKTFKQHMSDRGYEPIDRYPVIARWRDDIEFVGGSIYNFQPYVVSGEAEPPAPELIVPQPSLRFNDIDNVGITGRHYVLHNHIGQTCFQPPEKYDQDRYFKDMFDFAIEKLGIPKEKLILHEDAWGGGGNLGACMEFFVDGLELWNQVYMFYKQTADGYEELDQKVLDMGMGHERITWISHGTETSYECVMPETLKKMKEKVGLEVNQEVWEDFLPYSSYLNVDEVEDIDEKWEEIAEKIEIDVEDLKSEIKPSAALYSVAEHTRALIFALADGKIPSNTGGGHNLRVILRRSLEFIEKYQWDLDLEEIAEWNAKELKPMFPELEEKLPEIKKIIRVEKEKFEKSREKALKKLEEFDSQPSEEEMVELYESHGVSPELMEKKGFNVPEDFYSLVASEDEVVEKEIEEKLDVEDLSETELLYYNNPEPYLTEKNEVENPSFKAKILDIKDNWIILDRTLFYPKGGGQEYDKGTINGYQVEQVQKQDNIVLHKVPEHDLEPGKKIKGVINGERRQQLTQHHTSTHLVNGATKDILGDHIWQAGAHKTLEKGRLDVTHYEKPGRKTLDEIEEQVQEIIEENYEISRQEMKKTEAEEKYGFRIYQGGAPPGNIVRIIKIKDIDVEACGGTHLKETNNTGLFFITGCKRIQDGVIRLEYKSGTAAKEYKREIIENVEKTLEELPGSNKIEKESIREYRELERKLTNVFSVESEDLVSTVKRFKQEAEEKQNKIEQLANYLDTSPNTTKIQGETPEEIAQSLFKVWKSREKTIEQLEEQIQDKVSEKAQEQEKVREEIPTENIGLLIQIAKQLSNIHNTTVTLIGDKGAISASKEGNAIEELEDIGKDVQGDKKFAKTFKLK